MRTAFTILVLVSIAGLGALLASEHGARAAGPARQQTEKSTHPYGPDDERGALNRITPESVLAAIQLIHSGQVYDLGVTVDRNSPRWPGHAPVEVVTFRTPSGIQAQGDMSFTRPEKNPRHTFWMSNYLIMSDQVGTQIDGLSHITTGADNHWYNGFTEKEYLGDFGPKRADAASMPPIIARGVLIDVAGAKGVKALPADYGITPEDLISALKMQGTKLQPGDVVLIRTGTGAAWPDAAKMAASDTAGITLETAKWLVQQQAIIVGSDTTGLEQNPVRPDATELFPVHRYLLADQGVPIGEVHYLEDLARDKVYEFTYVCLTAKIRGSTAGFALRPIAIR